MHGSFVEGGDLNVPQSGSQPTKLRVGSNQNRKSASDIEVYIGSVEIFFPLYWVWWNWQDQISIAKNVILHPKGWSMEWVLNEIFCKPLICLICVRRVPITTCILAKGPYVYSGQSPGPYEGPTCTRCTGAKGPAWTFPNVKLQYWVVFWSERSLWYLRHCQCHWLQFWQLRSWIHDNLCYLTIKSDTGRHRQFLRCFFIMQVIFKTEESSETLPLNINWMELVYPKHWILWFGREKSMRRQFEEKKSTGHFSFFPLGLWGPLSVSPPPLLRPD